MKLYSIVKSIAILCVIGSYDSSHAELIDLNGIHTITEVRATQAVLVNGVSHKSEHIEYPITYFFYISLDEPRIIEQEVKNSILSDNFVESKLSGEEVENMPMMPASQYFVVHNKDSFPIALISLHDGNIVSISSILRAGGGVYQNDPDGGIGNYYNFKINL